MRAGVRSPRSQVTHGSGEKPWREKGAGAQRRSHYRRPRPRPRTALKPATRRGRLLGSTRPRAALLGLAAAAAPRTGRGDARREGRRPGVGGGRRSPGDWSDFLPPTARGVADVRPCSGGFPARRGAETPEPHLADLGGGSEARAWTFARRAAGSREGKSVLGGSTKPARRPLSGQTRERWTRVRLPLPHAVQGQQPELRSPWPGRGGQCCEDPQYRGGIAAGPRGTAWHRAESAFAACGQWAPQPPGVRRSHREAKCPRV